MSHDAIDPLAHTVALQKTGQAVGLYSICSAHRLVLEAAMQQALGDESAVLIESTSNQVDQFGGYTGMTPIQFAEFVGAVARDVGLPRHRVMLGGDHLGPNTWRAEPAAAAMTKACALVEACVTAGYTKIHLDASMHCADDPDGLDAAVDPATVSQRTAELCAAAEQAWTANPLGPRPRYVIGTEVPPPGGARETLHGVAATRAEDAAVTIALTHRAFLSRGLDEAWTRVGAVVVQPGVEFGDATVVAYDRPKAQALSHLIEQHENLVYEAHSTDYQTGTALTHMVDDHFAILKVGPWLTFAMREALFSLERMEREWLGHCRGALSNLRDTLERVMVDDPQHWQKHYHGDEETLRYARKYSYSDRSRYYWPRPELQQAIATLFANLAERPLPLTLLSQFMPCQYAAVREGRIEPTPREIVTDKIREVTGTYARACRSARIREMGSAPPDGGLAICSATQASL